jgi:hypothetical protein
MQNEGTKITVFLNKGAMDLPDLYVFCIIYTLIAYNYC